MQNKDIEIFLELVNTRNITKASENLFVAQSVISTRLKKLETELGYELFSRAKGMREIELTRSGREFVSVAMRLKNLYEEAAVLKGRTEHILRIACPESVYYDFLEPLAVRILKEYPDLKLTVQMLDSSEIYERMESGLIDFGFASYESTHSGILHSHIFDQKTCLVMRAEDGTEASPVSPEELDPEKEIRLSGGNFTNVSQWRDTWFPGVDRCRVEVTSPNMIAKYLKELDGWAILPATTAKMLERLYPVRTVPVTDLPESRKIYLLRHSGSQSESTEAVRIFEKEIKTYLEERNCN